jgi:hypothetical protein
MKEVNDSGIEDHSGLDLIPDSTIVWNPFFGSSRQKVHRKN